MIDELEIALVTRHPISRATIQNVLEHLIGPGPHDVDWSIAHLDRRARRTWLLTERKKGRQRGSMLVDDCLHQFHRALVRRTADVAGAHVVIVGKDAR